MTLSSPNRIVWTFFRSLRGIVAEVPKRCDETEQRDWIVLAVVLSVTAVEAFLNMYFRILVQDHRYQDHRSMILADLNPLDGAKPKGLEYKLNHWPPKVLGKSFAFQSGIACDFNRLRERRNALMHFTTTYESVHLPGIRINGLADTACYDTLTIKDAKNALRLAEGMLEETFRLSGVAEDHIPHRLHSWTGKPPRVAVG